MPHPTERVWTEITTHLGIVTLAATPLGVSGVWFLGQRHYPQGPLGRRDDQHPLLLRAQQQLQAYFAGTRREFTLPLDLDAGTAFQQSVWRTLLQIPVGATRSYAAISAQLGRPTAARAVGSAVGRNPLSIIVPCHRVVGTNGALTGYAGGLARKAQLLALEAAVATTTKTVNPVAKRPHAGRPTIAL